MRLSWSCNRDLSLQVARDLAAVAKNPSVINLELKKMKIGNEVAKVLASILRENPSLESFVLDTVQLSSTAVKHIYSGLEQNAHIEDLTLRNMTISGPSTAKELAVVLGSLPNLESFELDETNFSGVSSDIILEGLTAAKKLNCVEIYSIPLQTRGAEALVSVVESNRLERLDLYFWNDEKDTNNLADSSIASLLHAIGSHDTLETISIGGFALNNESVSHLCDTMKAIPALLGRLTLLGVSSMLSSDHGVHELVEVLENTTALRGFSCYENDIDAEACLVLLRTLSKYADQLDDLDFGRNNIGDQGAMALATLLHSSPKLEFIGLKGCTFSKAGSTALAAAVGTSTTLRKFYAPDLVKLGETDFQPWIDALKRNQSLASFQYDVDNTHPGQAQRREIVEAVKNHPKLETFEWTSLAEFVADFGLDGAYHLDTESKNEEIMKEVSFRRRLEAISTACLPNYPVPNRANMSPNAEQGAAEAGSPTLPRIFKTVCKGVV